jgi:hypothetical protein
LDLNDRHRNLNGTPDRIRFADGQGVTVTPICHVVPIARPVINLMPTLSPMAFSACLADGQAARIGTQFDPFRRIDAEHEAQEPGDDGDHEEAHGLQALTQPRCWMS